MDIHVLCRQSCLAHSTLVCILPHAGGSKQTAVPISGALFCFLWIWPSGHELLNCIYQLHCSCTWIFIATS